jgi:hypothetical protein
MCSKYIVNFLLLLVFSVSSTGVVIYEHYCTKSGERSHYFTEVDDVCLSQNDSCEQSQETTCCAKNNSKEDTGLEGKCCSTDVSFFQLTSDYSYTDSSELFKVNASAQSVLYCRTFFGIEYDCAIALRAPPPKKNLPQSRKIALLQVYRI